MKTIRLGVLTLCLSLGSISLGTAQLTATIIGSGSPAYDEDRANASVLISNGDTRILVDMGNGAQANLRALGVNPSTLSALLVTHHHLDHNEEFVPLLIHSLMGRHEFEIFGPPNTPQVALKYPIVDTGQERFYGNEGEIPRPGEDEAFYGQDSHFTGNAPSYSDNGDGTITDLVTGLMWQQGFDVMSYDEALEYADDASFAGYDDWRLPSIKEMYSLIRFDGMDPSGPDMGTVPEGAKPFIDTDFFDFEYGANGERVIDSQYLTTTIYTGLTMGRDRTVFGVNMADGRIKGYPMVDPRSRAAKDFSVKLVRGNPLYGQNQFVDNGDGTVIDAATGLMWTKEDSGQPLSWEGALAWVQQMNAESYLGHSDWKLPDAKELQSILDYSRSPQVTNSAAIDPVFSISTIKDESGEDGYPFFWSSTTHRSANGRGSSAVYLCFGEALGYMRFPGSGEAVLLDVHGAGAQRSDPKVGDASDYPQGHGPQGDVVRISHYVRLVRAATAGPV